MQKYNIKLILWMMILVFIDQVSKYFFYDKNYLNQAFLITKTLNEGISWWIDIFHINILLVLIPVILVTIIYLYHKKEIWLYTFLFMFAGWVWNYLDRIFYHGVRDFIDFHFFPIFNVADIYVSIGALLLIISIIKLHHQKD